MRRMIYNGIAAVLALAFAFVPIGTAKAESQGMIVKQSAFGVGKTLDRMGIAMERAGIKVFARINHGKAAKSVGQEIGDIQLMVFGNPKLGSPLMASNPTIGIDLPLKVVAWKDAAGKVWLGVNDPAHLAARHGITDKDAVFKKMTGALNSFMGIATTKGALKPANRG